MEITLPEIVATGIYNLKIPSKNKMITSNRKTTMFEIEIPIESGGFSYINSNEMPIEPNMIICAKPGQVRNTRFPFKCYYIHMILKDGALYDNLMEMPDFIKINKYDKYLNLFKKIMKYYETALDSDEIILHSLILELVYELIKDSKKQLFREKSTTGNSEIIEKVIKYIKENLTSALSLEQVSQYAGFSPIHFHNCFKSATGKTLHKYVEEQRIKKAANLLVTTNNTLTKIAYECGFSSQSYFSYAFKREMKIPPREYAKKVFRQYEQKGNRKSVPK